VVTTSFYKLKGEKIATSHAHGDGTWSVAFTALGVEELGKQKSSAAIVRDDELEVLVRTEVIAGRLFHHGEMKYKPQACRGDVSLNNDEVHRVHHDEPGASEDEDGTGQEVRGDGGGRPDIQKSAHQTANRPVSASVLTQYQHNRNLLHRDQEQLALSLAKPDLSRKEERALFQQLKAMPWEAQERILKHSNWLKLQDRTASNP
jgi:hypothetical protein